MRDESPPPLNKKMKKEIKVSQEKSEKEVVNWYKQYNIQFIEGGMRMNLEKIVAILIRLLEDQENAKITYQIIPDNTKKEDESA